MYYLLYLQGKEIAGCCYKCEEDELMNDIILLSSTPTATTLPCMSAEISGFKHEQKKWTLGSSSSTTHS